MPGKFRSPWFVISVVCVIACSVAPAWAQLPRITGPFNSVKVEPEKVTVDPAALARPQSQVKRVVPEGKRKVYQAPGPKLQEPDGITQLTGATSELTDAPDALGAPLVNFAGISTGCNPPDTVGDIGPNHYVQMVNCTSFQIWDKEGNSLQGPSNFGNLWPAGDPCNSNAGDPIVVYDHLANRWVLSQFASEDSDSGPADDWMCVAVSQTPDPTANSWFLYTFDMNQEFPDYPKFGVWPDGYYMSSYESDQLGVFVFDRASMLAGQAASFSKFTVEEFGTATIRDTRILPSDLDGPAPAAGTPNFFVQTVDQQQDPLGDDRIIIFEFEADFSTNTFSFTPVTTLTAAGGDIAPFNIMSCDRGGGGLRDCIPAPDTAGTIDALSNRPMMQLKYRNFGTHEAMVFNQTIDVSGSINGLLGFTPTEEVAGIRWYELRRNGGAWDTNQQGTYAPQPNGATTEAQLLHRWMGSTAMDAQGNIALGYSIVNDDDANEVFPGIRYTGRLSTDVANTLPQIEQVILNGTTTVGGAAGQRWGDYSAMSVDPVDDCTFYYTTHVAGGATRIAAFRFNTCGTDLRITKADSPDPVIAGTDLRYDLTVTNLGGNVAEAVQVLDTLPAGVTYISNTDACVESPIGTLTCDLGNILPGGSKNFTINVAVSPTAIIDGITTLTNTAVVSSLSGDTNLANNTVEASTTVIARADLRVLKTCKPDGPAPSGSTAHCEITVENLGPSAAQDVTLVDDLTSNAPFVVTSISVTPPPGSCLPATPTAAVTDLTITCDLDNLLPGATKTVRVEFSSETAADVNDIATVSSATVDPNPANNVATGRVSFVASADLLITKNGPASANFLGSFAYTIFVDNLGPSGATGVVVTETLPAGVLYNSAVASKGTFTAINGVVTWNIGNLGAAEVPPTLTINVTVLPTAPAAIVNNASVTSTTADPNLGNNLATLSTTVVGADPWMEKTGTEPAGNPAGALIYTLTVHNNAGSAPDATPTSGFGGPNSVQNVVVTDPLPLDNKKVIVQFLSPGCTYAAGTHTVTCTAASLPANTAVSFSIQIQVKGSNGTLTNQASFTTTTFDPNLTNNSDSVNNVVQGGTGKGRKP